MGLVIASTSVLLLHLSAPEEAGANSASLQISDALSNIVLLAAGGAAFASLGGGTVDGHGHLGGRLPPRRLRRRVPADGRGGAGGRLGDDPAAGTVTANRPTANWSTTAAGWLYRDAVEELPLRLAPGLARDLADLADARDQLPEEVAVDAVRRYLHDEGEHVRSLATRLAEDHAGLRAKAGE